LTTSLLHRRAITVLPITGCSEYFRTIFFVAFSLVNRYNTGALKTKILIYSPEISPRLRYICRLIFNDILQAEFELITNAALFRSSAMPRLNYSEHPFENEPFLKANRLLFSNTKQFEPLVSVECQGETGFFPTSAGSILPFDPLASSFFCVSRMEEYADGVRDIHGRFEAGSSVLHTYGLLEKPMVNIWARLLMARLINYYPTLKLPDRYLTRLCLVDIDNAWAYKGKGLMRTAGGFIRDLLQLNLRNAGMRLAVLSGFCRDPYDTYGYLTSVLPAGKGGSLFFFHLGDYARYDKPVSWKNKKYRKLISQISQRF
jgi:hypothetical protein